PRAACPLTPCPSPGGRGVGVGGSARMGDPQEDTSMRFVRSPLLCLVGTALAAAVVWTAWAPAQQPEKKPTGLEEKKPPAAPVESAEDFAKEMAKFKADKP